MKSPSVTSVKNRLGLRHGETTDHGLSFDPSLKTSKCTPVNGVKSKYKHSFLNDSGKLKHSITSEHAKHKQLESSSHHELRHRHAENSEEQQQHLANDNFHESDDLPQEVKIRSSSSKNLSKLGPLSSMRLRSCQSSVGPNPEDSALTDNPMSGYSDSTLEHSSSDEITGAISRSLTRFSLRSRPSVVNNSSLKLVGPRLDSRIRLEPIPRVDSKSKEPLQGPNHHGEHKRLQRSLLSSATSTDFSSSETETLFPNRKKLDPLDSGGSIQNNKRTDLPKVFSKIRKETENLIDVFTVKNKLGLDKRKEASLDSLMSSKLEHDGIDENMSKASSLDTLRQEEHQRTGCLVRSAARENLCSSKYL